MFYYGWHVYFFIKTKVFHKNCWSVEETKNAELVKEKEKKLCFKNLIIHGVEKSSSDNKDGAIKSDDIDI